MRDAFNTASRDHQEYLRSLGRAEDPALTAFRGLADLMAGPEPRDWEWVGPHMSQRMFGITEARARAYAERHGGTARKQTTSTGSAS